MKVINILLAECAIPGPVFIVAGQGHLGQLIFGGGFCQRGLAVIA